MIRRLLRWFIFLASCGAVGAAVFGYVRQQPRLVIHDALGMEHLGPVGTSLIVRPRAGAAGLQRWDARTGRMEHVFLQDVEMGKWAGGDTCGSLVAVAPGEGSVRVADWRRDAEFTVRLGEGQTVSRLQFSPKGRWLLARLPWQALDCYIDVPGRRVVQRREDSFVGFSGDEEFLVVRNHRDWDEPLTVVSLPSGDVHGRGPAPLSHVAMAPAGALMAVCEVRREPKHMLVLEVWDMRALRRCFAHQEPAGHLRRMEFSADGKLLLVAFTNQPDQVDGMSVFDTATGKVVAGHADLIQMIETPAGTLLAQYGEKLTVLDATGRTLWSRKGAEAFWAARDTLCCRSRAGALIEFLDAATGSPRASVATEPCLITLPKLTPDGRHALLDTFRPNERLAIPWPAPPPPVWKQWLVRFLPWLSPKEGPGRHVKVIDTVSGDTLFHLYPWQAQNFFLSDEATVVVGVENQGAAATIRVWDVSAARAWRWAITAGVAAALAMWLLGHGLRRWRGRVRGRQPGKEI
jgi:hypothetical protein